MHKHDSIHKSCDLCGLDAGRQPFTRTFSGAEKAFCCLGCMNVYTILLESGAICAGQDLRETELFRRSLAMGLVSTGDARGNGMRDAIPPDAPTAEALFHVAGMWCSSCAWLIEHALSNERGIIVAEAFFASDLLKVKYCPQYLPPDRITRRIETLGYKVSEYTGENTAAQAEKRDLLLRLGIAGFLWMNIMTLSMALYVGYFQEIAGSVRRFLPFVLMGLATPVVFYCAMPILRLMWQGFVHRAVRMETLLGIGILAAYVYSAVQTIRGDGHVYFDTASAIVALVLFGKLIERNAKERMSRAITQLYRMMPKKVRLQAGGGERFVSIDALGAGDRFVVKAGERIPADGVVIEGHSHADESLLTGESAPVEKEPGAAVVAGSVNAGGVLHVRATKVGPDSTLAQIIRLVEQALGSKSALERTVDRVSRIFVPGVIAIAAATFLVCWLGGLSSAGDALMRAITVLVIACPCALGMATPLAMATAIGAASRHGILVRDSRVLERIRDVDTVIFDKTGTVTEGDFSLLDLVPEGQERFVGGATTGLSGREYLMHRVPVVPPPANFRRASGAKRDLTDKTGNPQRDSLLLLASLERYSEHPLGRAIVKSAEGQGIELQEAQEVEVHKGQGITGWVAGRRVFIGNRRLAESENAFPDAARELLVRKWERAGRTVAFFGWDRQLRGLLAFGDRVKPEAAAVAGELKERGIRVLLVSGDARDTTRWIASTIGADEFVAEALPDEKTRVVERLQQQGQVVAMIGDGINDAPALARADLSVAMGAGADIAMRASAIVLMNNSLYKVLDAFALSRKTWRVIRQNLFWAFLYNTLGIGLAVTGILNPIMAAAAMLLSSLSVIGNSSRLSASINSGAKHDDHQRIGTNDRPGRVAEDGRGASSIARLAGR